MFDRIELMGKFVERIKGFTIVELLVVIATIGVLAGITIFGFSTFQASARDSQRAAKATIISEALEKFYDENGEYPSCPAITGPVNTVTSTVLPGVDAAAVVTPQATSGETNSIKCQNLTSLADPDIFAYVGDGSTACTSGTSCLSYSIKYKEEGTGTIKTLDSRRQTDLATSGQIGTNFSAAVAAGAVGLNQINLTWPGVTNAASYTLQRASNNTFTTGLAEVTPSASDTTYGWSGLTAGTQYYFRIKANSSNNTTNWSNVANATTAKLSTPAITTTVNSLTQVTVNWSAINYSTGYTLQVATNNSFTANLVTTNPTGTSSAVSGLSSGTTYYFRLQATNNANPGDTSSWSPTITQATPSLATPVITATPDSGTQITVNWSAITYATGYTLDRSTAADFSANFVRTYPTGTSSVVTGLSTSVTYYFRLQATAPSDTSNWSNTANATTIVPPPTCSSTVVNSNTQITVTWGAVTNATKYNLQISTNSGYNPGGYVWDTTATSVTATGLNNGTTYYFRVQAFNGSFSSAWSSCPTVSTGVSGPVSAGYSYGGCCQVVCIGCVDWVGDNANGYSGNYYASHVDTYGSCSGGATFEIYMDAWYAYSNGGSANTYAAEGWTNGNRSWWMINGSDSWYGWYNAKVSCVINGQRAGGWSMGTIGGY